MNYTQKSTINGGLYLVADPSLPLPEMLHKLKQALDAGLNVLQVWDHFPPGTDALAYTKELMRLAAEYRVPVIINENRELFLHSGADGIHFDRIPEDLAQVKEAAARPFLTGITCGNQETTILWAEKNGLDYISFCSMFPSSSAGVCEIVDPKMVRKAGEMYNGTIFLSGGITHQNISKLRSLGMHGIAVISGILQAPDPGAATAAYLQLLNENRVSETP